MSFEDVGEGLEPPVKLLFKSIFVFCSVFCVFFGFWVFGLWWWWVVTVVRCLMFIDESGGGSFKWLKTTGRERERDWDLRGGERESALKVSK